MLESRDCLRLIEIGIAAAGSRRPGESDALPHARVAQVGRRRHPCGVAEERGRPSRSTPSNASISADISSPTARPNFSRERRREPREPFRIQRPRRRAPKPFRNPPASPPAWTAAAPASRPSGGIMPFARAASAARSSSVRTARGHGNAEAELTAARARRTAGLPARAAGVAISPV